MGYLFQGVCYPTELAAKKTVCSVAGKFDLDGGDLHVSGCLTTDFSGSTFDVAVATNDSLNGIYTFGFPAFMECDHTYTSDLSLAWMGAALLLFCTLFGFKHLYNLFSGRYDE